MEFSQILKEVMDDKSITMYRLAKELGIHQTTIRNWLDGKGEPRISEIYRLANALGVDPFSLLSWDQATAALEERINARERINSALENLNEAGIEKAADLVELIAEIQRFRLRDPAKAVRPPAEDVEGIDLPPSAPTKNENPPR